MNQRYAYIQYTEIPGVRAHSIFVTQTCSASSSLGKETFLIIPNEINQEYTGKDSIWKHYGIPKSKFKIIRILNKQKIINRLFPVGHYSSHLIKVFIFAIKSWLKTKQLKLDIIQTSDPEVVTIFSILSWIYNPKIIFDTHIDLPKWFPTFILKKIDLVASNTNYFKKSILNRGISSNKIIELPNGYNKIDYQQKENKKLKASLGFNNKDFIVGYIGRLETMSSSKGVGELIKLLPSIKNNSVKLLIVGGPDKLLHQYKSLVKALKIRTDKVIFTGQISPAKASQYIKLIDLAWMVYPDTPHYRYKMSPMKAIEYMAAKKPIIASDFSSVRQLLNENNAFLVDPRNRAMVLEVTQQAIDNSKVANQRAQKAFDNVKNLTWKDRQKNIFNHI